MRRILPIWRRCARRLTRITQSLFCSCWIWLCGGGLYTRSHRPAVALAACFPLLAIGILLLCRGPVSLADVYSPVQGTSVSDCTGANALTVTEVEWTMPGEKPDQCEIHAVYSMAMFGAVFENRAAVCLCHSRHRYAAAAQAGTAGERTAPAAGNAGKHRLL